MTLTTPDAPALSALNITRDGAVLRVQLNSGPGNILTPGCVRELTGVLTAVRDQPSIRVVVLAGGGEERPATWRGESFLGGT